jgi:hypothetical protein
MLGNSCPVNGKKTGWRPPGSCKRKVLIEINGGYVYIRNVKDYGKHKHQNAGQLFIFKQQKQSETKSTTDNQQCKKSKKAHDSSSTSSFPEQGDNLIVLFYLKKRVRFTWSSYEFLNETAEVNRIIRLAPSSSAFCRVLSYHVFRCILTKRGYAMLRMFNNSSRYRINRSYRKGLSAFT